MSKSPFPNPTIQNIDNIIDRIDIVEADGISEKTKNRRVKFVQITTVSGEQYTWFPYYKLTIKELEKLAKETKEK
jgi:hypothetical protein